MPPLRIPVKYARTSAASKLAAITKTVRSGRSSAVSKFRTAQLTARSFRGASGDAKYVDTAYAGYAFDTTGTVTHISIVPQGTTVNNRDGKAFRCTSVQVRGSATADTTTTYSQGAAYLVWDRQPNKALAAVTDVLDTAGSQSFSKRENAARFKILKKWRYVFAGNITTPATEKVIYDVDDYVKLPADCVAACTTADTTGAIGNRITGALLLVTCGNTAAGTADASFTVGVRTNIMDM